MLDTNVPRTIVRAISGRLGLVWDGAVGVCVIELSLIGGYYSRVGKRLIGISRMIRWDSIIRNDGAITYRGVVE